MPLENQIQRGDLVQRLTRALEIKGVRSPVLSLENAVVPIVLLEDLTKQTEWVSAKDRGASIGVNIAAVVGEKGGLAIINPTDSGVIVAIDSLHVSVSTASDIKAALVDQATVEATYITTSQAFWTDERNPGFSTARQANGTDAGLLPSNALIRIRVGSANALQIWSPNIGAAIIVPPGRALVVECDTPNQGVTVHATWREIAEP